MNVQRSCLICKLEFTCDSNSTRKNCHVHTGMRSHKQRMHNDILQRKCTKCLRWEEHESFPKKDCGKHSWCQRCLGADSYRYQAERGSKRRAELIAKAGGSCTICGYDKCDVALTFHHKEPLEKLFSLDTRSCSNRSMKKLLTEFKKCILLCHNCHMEHHHALTD